jgi:hypothetical protein
MPASRTAALLISAALALPTLAQGHLSFEKQPESNTPPVPTPANAIPSSPPDEVTIGGPAPNIEVEKWIKGEPVTAFGKGIYVVEIFSSLFGR